MDSISLSEARERDWIDAEAPIRPTEEASAPDMSVLNEGRRSAPPLPLEVFGPWSEWIKATAEGTSAPADYVAVALLTGAAAVIGNARWVSPWQGWKEPCALWAALIGKPSSGKSPAIDPVISMMRTMESEMAVSFEVDLREWRTNMEAAKCSRENWQSDVKTAVKNGIPAPQEPTGAVEPEKPVRPRLAVSDTTPEALAAIMAGQPRGLLTYRDELSGWLGSFDRYGSGSGERGFWLEAYGGRSFVLDRVKLDAPLRIPYLTVSVLGGIQPDKLVSTLMAGDDDGLAARMLFTWPEPVTPARPKSIADDVGAMIAMRRLRSLQMVPDDDGQPGPLVLPMSDDAADLVDQWRQAHFESAEAASGMVAGHFGKMPGLLLRLSLVLEHLWWCRSADCPSTPTPLPFVSVLRLRHLARPSRHGSSC